MNWWVVFVWRNNLDLLFPERNNKELFCDGSLKIDTLWDQNPPLLPCIRPWKEAVYCLYIIQFLLWKHSFVESLFQSSSKHLPGQELWPCEHQFYWIVISLLKCYLKLEEDVLSECSHTLKYWGILIQEQLLLMWTDSKSLPETSVKGSWEMWRKDVHTQIFCGELQNFITSLEDSALSRKNPLVI